MIVHRSPFPDIAIPRQTIGACVLAGFAGREDEPVLIDGPTGRALTGRQLVEAVKRLAGGLTARGLGAGHVVAIMAPNLPEYAVLFHGVAWAGGTVTTVNPTYTAGGPAPAFDGGRGALGRVPQRATAPGRWGLTTTPSDV